MYTENGNGFLNLSQFEPFSKNPPIAKVFREVSLANELGFGTQCNMYLLILKIQYFSFFRQRQRYS